MGSKPILIALFIVSVIVLGAILWRNARFPEVASAPVVPKTTVLVSARPLRTGTLLRAEDVKWQIWKGQAPASAIVRPSEAQRRANPEADERALSNAYGAVLRQRLGANQAILRSMIIRPGDRGFLAAVLAPGHRAISIGVTPVSGASGLIYPGDHVDVILTQKFTKAEEPMSRRSVAETIVKNLRVLAIDQRLQQASAAPTKEDPIPRTVTLEVLPKQAEMITVAAQLGNLSLILRSVPRHPEPVTTDNVATETRESTWADDVSPALRPPKRSVARSLSPFVHIMRGSKMENVRD